jgi:DegV family protein with EDD domain
MTKVIILTDSSACLSENDLENYPIHVIPLQVIFGSDTYLDGIDIHADEFYKKLRASKVSPSSSQPSPSAFIEKYTFLAEQGYDILSMHISEKLSGTLASAHQAKVDLPGHKVEIVDSFSVSMALGFQVLAVARAAREGASLQECKALAEQARENAGALFVVQTLEYLRRGGRIGGATAFLGTALNLKPVLELREGRVEPLERVRTMNKATERLLDHLEERLQGKRHLRLACLHAENPVEAANLQEQVIKRFPPSSVSEVIISEISPLIGTHTGPGTLGIAFTSGM